LSQIWGQVHLGIVAFIGLRLRISHKATSQGSMGVVSYDVSRLWIATVLIVAASVFGAGFYWEFRRAKLAQ
jgi:hypothetical protein